jgi:hypothetical protein
MTTEELIKKYLYIPVEGEKINTDRPCPSGYPYIQIDVTYKDKDRYNSKREHVALLDTGQLVYMDNRGSFEKPFSDISLGRGVYHHTVVRK